jgi:uncharacterized protein YhbP (UPF0306 family)
MKELIKEILTKGYLMSLGTHDDGGVWVSDVVYMFDDELRIYWISSPEVRHSRAIAEGAPVAGTITLSGPGEKNMGIQFSGTAIKIEGPRWDLAKVYYQKLNKPEPREDDNILRGRSWYQLIPHVIDLTYEPLYGFGKQKLEL